MKHKNVENLAMAGLSDASINALVRRLAWIITLILLAATLAIAGSFYLLQSKPLAAADVLARQQTATEQVLSKLDALSSTVERLLPMGRDWTNEGLIDLEDIRAFNRLLLPALVEHPVLSSLYLARSDGRMFFLMRDGERWKNRITDVAKQGTRQHWLHWRDKETQAGDEWVDQPFDPRQRPWYQGTMAVAEGELYWTAPYQFASAPAPGITAALRWTDAVSGQTMVFAADILLTDLADFISSLSYSTNGEVALLTTDGNLLAPPGQRIRNGALAAATLKESLLKQPDAAGYPLLAAALRQAPGRESPDREIKVALPAGIAGNREEWLASLRPLPLGQEQLILITLAPTSDFAPMSSEGLALLLLVMLSIALLATLAMHAQVWRMRRPIIKTLTWVEQTRQLAEQETHRHSDTAAIVARLQQATTPAELGRILLTELAQRLPLARGIYCLWQPEQQRLECIARYAGAQISSDSEEIDAAPARGLLLQCARDQQPILLNNPPAGYFDIHSGLGAHAPVALLLHPLRNGDKLCAVVELASLRAFTPSDRQLLEVLETTLCLSLDHLLQAQATSALLRQTARNEARHRLILNSTDDGILGLDAAGHITFSNRSALALLGYAEPEVVGLAMKDVHSHAAMDSNTGAQPESLCPIQLTLQDGEARRVADAFFFTKDARALPVRYSTTSIMEQGQLLGAVIVFSARPAEPSA
ncbi:GAF domain-containing protein [Thiorhodovibrio frisius]|uniref:PAS domain S-box n=1 Tax=Thiorhodovibrio frisius TaxID=631362 RepID=H8Z2M2_9GAMM|nr:GAF domain-containing protein [Thiorhodovibrio frisius]EIC22715.1 PAS domain S-box [Thiorhodovibrio frisius]WPL22472.1 sensory histidine kinase AtoS [Thiorhodovibrio frisius]